LIPVAAVAWYGKNRLISVALCFFSALTWRYVDNISGGTYSTLWVPVWNSLVRLGFFLIIAYLLHQLRTNLDLQASRADVDGLTGLLNARAFRDRCEAAFQQASRHQHPLAIGYLDLDGFKGINDNFGHAMGDRVLKAVAETLTDRVRSSDICARLGGDEFVILLPETELAGAQTFFTALHQSLLELFVLQRWSLGCSVGVAVFPLPPSLPEDAIKRADKLMYEVKHSGKNRIHFKEIAL
jgi:diguanylate cyclase (GGDEF)-like protein